jgi:thiamine monophosphate synthase
MAKTKKKLTWREKYAKLKAKFMQLRESDEVRKEGTEAYIALRKAVKEFKEFINAVRNV